MLSTPTKGFCSHILVPLKRGWISIKNDWEKVLADGVLDCQSEQIANDRDRCQTLLAELNATPAANQSLRQNLCTEIFGQYQISSWIVVLNL